MTDDVCAPLSELGRTDRVNTVSHADNGIKVIKLHHTFDVSIAFRLNYFHFGNSCLFPQFTIRKDIHKMFVDGRNSDVKQYCHRFLGSPNSLVLI